ncbi:MAG: hypothetical protein JNK63_01130 [Chthonomonas sp.]|nr:hypothetical protein [Chthonomonas sp.]
MSEVRLKIKILTVTPGVWCAIQEGKGSAGKPVDLRKPEGGDVEWVVTLSLKNGKPTGSYAQKDSKGAFIYILWGTNAGQAGTCVSRRAKVYLPPELEADALYEVEFEGRDKSGLPACASVKPIEGWKQSGTF